VALRRRRRYLWKRSLSIAPTFSKRIYLLLSKQPSNLGVCCQLVISKFFKFISFNIFFRLINQNKSKQRRTRRFNKLSNLALSVVSFNSCTEMTPLRYNSKLLGLSRILRVELQIIRRLLSIPVLYRYSSDYFPLRTKTSENKRHGLLEMLLEIPLHVETWFFVLVLCRLYWRLDRHSTSLRDCLQFAIPPGRSPISVEENLLLTLH
jgi:hypothetical protein